MLVIGEEDHLRVTACCIDSSGRLEGEERIHDLVAKTMVGADRQIHQPPCKTVLAATDRHGRGKPIRPQAGQGPGAEAAHAVAGKMDAGIIHTGKLPDLLY